LILRKISKFDATRCLILRLKCTKFDFRCGSAPDPAGELTELSPKRPSGILNSLLLRGGRGRGRGGEGERTEKEEEWE